MKTSIIGKAMPIVLMFMFVNSGCARDGQAPTATAGTSPTTVQTSPETKKLGYGFEPGLVSGKDYVAGQLIVGYKEGANTQAIVQAASAFGGQLGGEIQGNSLLLQFASEKDVEAAAPALLARPDVVFVERNGLMRIPPQPQLPPMQRKR